MRSVYKLSVLGCSTHYRVPNCPWKQRQHNNCSSGASWNRLLCGCSVMEIHYRKLLMNSYCADVASRGSLELGSECSNQGQIFTHYSTLWSHSVSLCGLPLLFWVVVGPRHFHFTITAVDRFRSRRAEVWRTDLLERWHPMMVLHWKLQLFSKANLVPMFVYGDCTAVCSILYTCQQWVWLE